MPPRRIISPSSIPGGIFTVISCWRSKTPSPRQVAHLSFGTCPLPWQRSQTFVVLKTPMNERLVSLTLPFPLHFLHVSIFEPGEAPLPLQVRHEAVLVSKISRSTPKTDSSNETWISMEISRPLCCLACLPPPKKSPKISPISNSNPCPLPWVNWEKSKPPKPPCPPKPPAPGLNPAPADPKISNS